MNQAARIVKKYPNRRLYDTHESRYITLNDVRQLVAAGRAVTVIENKTGRDITCSILMQVITELDIPGGPPMSEHFLTSIIRAHECGFTQLISNYLDRSLQLAIESESLRDDLVPRNGDAQQIASFERWRALQRTTDAHEQLTAHTITPRSANDIGA
jgi:polyhydroxyalkanoate synthesis repressor PhaR